MSREDTFVLTGPAGQLEAIASPAQAAVHSRAVTAVVCHPHPQQGGTMTNKVVTTLTRTFADLGIGSVRFNFRGVGQSAGEFAQGIGEVEDVLAVCDWVKATFPTHAIWLAGFSFGAAMSAQAATRVDVQQLVSIAPPVPRFGLPELAPVTCPWLIAQGELDDVVIPEDVFQWAASRTPAPTVIRMPAAGHFFHGQLMELRRLLEAALQLPQ